MDCQVGLEANYENQKSEDWNEEIWFGEPIENYQENFVNLLSEFNMM